jgi:uncharacterized membrane protein YcaP (DUF421 family)
MIFDFLDRLLGLQVESRHLTFAHMAWRSVVIFIFGVVLMRLADRRFLGRNAGFDVLLGVVLGSVLSRGINGQAAFFPTLGACLVLVILHHLLATAACHSHVFSQWVKGLPQILVRSGKIDEGQLRRNKMTADDLLENIRLNGNAGRPEDVAEAWLERNGTISIIKKKESR